MKVNYMRLANKKIKPNELIENPTLGAVLKWERKNQRLTLEEGAEGICSTSYLSKLENNQINPSETILKKLSKRLGIEEVFEYNLERFDEVMNETIRLSVNQKGLSKMYYQIYSPKKDQKSRLIVYAYYITNQKYDRAVKIYSFIEEEIDKYNLLEINLFYYLTSKLLKHYGKYVQALRVLRLTNFLEEYPELKLLIEFEKVDLKLRLGKYLTVRQDLEVTKRKLLELQWLDYYKELVISGLLESFSEVDFSYIESKINDLKEFSKPFVKRLLFSAIVYYDKKYRNLMDFKEWAEKDPRIYALYLLYLDQNELPEDINSFVSKNKFHTDNPLISELKFFLTKKYELEPNAFLRYVRTLKNSLFENYNGVIFIKYLLERTAKYFEEQKYYKTATGIRKILTEIINTLKTI